LKIAFDAKRAFNNLTGLGNYSRSVISSISKKTPQSTLYLFTPKEQNHIFKLQSDNNQVIKPKKWSNQYYWRMIGLNEDLQKLKIDLYHGLSNEIPLHTPIKTIVTIHDLLFLKYPQLYSFIDRKIYTIKSKIACNNATKIIATSESTKEDIVNYFNINPEKIKVIYQSCHQDFINYNNNEELDPKIKEKTNNPYLLYVGTIEKRKNLLFLLQALIKMKEVNLICIGKKTNYYKTISAFIHKYKLHHRISFFEFIDTRTLSILYRNSRALIYPSIDEGFGIPIIEAMYSSTPVVISNNKIFREIGGESAYYFEQDNIESLIAEIKKVWFETNERDDRIAKNSTYVQRFNEENQANEIINLYKTLI